MKHFLNVCDINGGNVPPVDLITFGSPCQDLSVAGKRAGLKHESNGDDETTRSGLFMEAVRIIREMRRETDGRYPTFALWENVPGAFSSNKGEDFRIVLEELAKTADETVSIPMPPKGKWTTSGYMDGDGWSIAWRVVDAQYHGVPQRRRRILLVADFGGQRAGEISFECEGLPGYPSESGEPWEAASSDAQGGSGADDSAVSVVCYDARGNGEGNVVPTITGDHENRITDYTAVAIEPKTYSIQGSMIGREDKNDPQGDGVNEETSFTLNTIDRHAVAYGIGSYDSKGMKSDNPLSGIYEADTSRTLDLNGGNPACNQGGIAIVEPFCFGNGQADVSSHITKEMSQTLNCMHDQLGVCYGLDRASFNQGENAKYDFSVLEEQQPTLTARGPGAVCNQETYQKTTGPLMANSHPGSYSGQDAYTDMLVCENDKVRYIVRRLTPTECARLQGFPDLWGHIDQKQEMTDEEVAFWNDVYVTHQKIINGKDAQPKTKSQLLTWYNKLHTDGAEYKMWGNGVALPCVRVPVHNMAKLGVKTMASLFDGSGGFPLASVLEGIIPVWCSEIEPYPIAVTVERFKEGNNHEQNH